MAPACRCGACDADLPGSRIRRRLLAPPPAERRHRRPRGGAPPHRRQAGWRARFSSAQRRLRAGSLGSGFWIALLGFGLIAADALVKLALKPVARVAITVVAVIAAVAILSSDLSRDLSIMREYLRYADSFWNEAVQHLVLVFGSLVPAILIGVPLGYLPSLPVGPCRGASRGGADDPEHRHVRDPDCAPGGARGRFSVPSRNSASAASARRPR